MLLNWKKKFYTLHTKNQSLLKLAKILVDRTEVAQRSAAPIIEQDRFDHDSLCMYQGGCRYFY